VAIALALTPTLKQNKNKNNKNLTSFHDKSSEETRSGSKVPQHNKGYI
jgi:hypothetical protein